jgi:fructokinase
MNIVTSYLAQGLTAVARILAPQRIIVGSGVAKLRGFHEILNEAVAGELAKYPGLAEHQEPGFVSPPGLGDRSGLAGGLVLAQQVFRGQVEAVDDRHRRF